MIITFIFLILLEFTPASSTCLDLQASATHAVAYSKKSLSSDNFDHQQYYAERALVALDKTEKNLQHCGCPGSVDPLLDSREALEKALHADSWEKGRFYSQRALEDGRKMIEAIDICLSGITE